MIGSRYKRAGDKRRDIYAVIGPASEIGSVREWVLRNEKNTADEVIVTAGARQQLMRTIASHPDLFLVALLDRQRTNLALARFRLADAERSLG